MTEVKIVWLDTVWREYKDGRDTITEFGSPAAERELAHYLNRGWQIKAAGGGGGVPDDVGEGLFCFVVLVRER